LKGATPEARAPAQPSPPTGCQTGGELALFDGDRRISRVASGPAPALTSNTRDWLSGTKARITMAPSPIRYLLRRPPSYHVRMPNEDLEEAA
jgi:hypothetical protein